MEATNTKRMHKFFWTLLSCGRILTIIPSKVEPTSIWDKYQEYEISPKKVLTRFLIEINAIVKEVATANNVGYRPVCQKQAKPNMESNTK